LGSSENIGCDAYDFERRATFVARLFGATDCLFKSGSGSKAEPCARERQTFVDECNDSITMLAPRPE